MLDTGADRGKVCSDHLCLLGAADEAVEGIATCCGDSLRLLDIGTTNNLADFIMLIRVLTDMLCVTGGCALVSSAAVRAIAMHCHNIHSLGLARLPLLQDYALASFTTTWCYKTSTIKVKLDNELSTTKLEKLALHNCDQISSAGVKSMTERAPLLHTLDISE